MFVQNVATLAHRKLQPVATARQLIEMYDRQEKSGRQQSATETWPCCCGSRSANHYCWSPSSLPYGERERLRLRAFSGLGSLLRLRWRSRSWSLSRASRLRDLLCDADRERLREYERERLHTETWHSTVDKFKRILKTFLFSANLCNDNMQGVYKFNWTNFYKIPWRISRKIQDMFALLWPTMQCTESTSFPKYRRKTWYDWLTKHGFTSGATQYRLYGRQFL